MSNTDRSASVTIRANRNKALATYYKQNQNTANQTMADATFYVGRVEGQLQTCCAATECTAPVITNFTVISDSDDPGLPLVDDDIGAYYDFTWDAIPGATYSIISRDANSGIDLGDTIQLTGATARVIIVSGPTGGNERTITLTATKSCGSATTSENVYPCFLAGSLVQMADGTTKAIEDVRVGDVVLGAFGEANPVLALHRPLLGTALMCHINEEHYSTNHHPHVSVDMQFYCGDPDLVSTATYGRPHTVLNAEGKQVMSMLYGLKKERIRKLAAGVVLKTVEGSRVVRTLSTLTMPEDTQLYNLVVGGSHTYHVDGYAVTGWPREDDFDYDTWAPL